MKEFGEDYNHLAISLQVMNKRLVLLNPKFVNREAAVVQEAQQEKEIEEKPGPEEHSLE